MKVAVVILNYNGAKLLADFLPIVCRYSQGQAEVFVADNGSSDNSLSLLAEQFLDVRVVSLDKNYGFAGGYNRALEQVEAEYYVLLNSDVEVTQGWLSVIEYMDKNPDVVACQPKIRSWYNRNQFEYAGACGGYIDAFGYPFCRGRILQTVEIDSGQYDSVTDLFWATGACLVVRAASFWAVGGFDARFFAHMEEIDLCWRLHGRICSYPASVVYHVGAKTLSQESPFKTFLNFRNNHLMLYKNMPRCRWFFVFLVRMLLDYVAVLQHLVCAKWATAWAIVRARCAFYQNMKYYSKSAKPKRRVGIYPRLLIVDYYLLGKRRFSEIKRRIS